MRRVLRWLRDSFISGLLVVFPLGLTLYVLWLLYRLLRGALGPNTPFAQLLIRTFGRYIPGTEIVITALVVILIGAAARNWLGRTLLSSLEKLVLSLPGVRKLYWATRQLSYALLRRDGVAQGKMRRLVLMEFPREGYYVMGVLTNDEVGSFKGVFDGPCVSVYVPTAPNPLSGWVFFVPKERVIPVDMTVDEGLALVLSGGVVAPEEADRKEKPQEGSDADQAG
ncbi:MAG: Uncharacterized protein XD60_0540 [Acetothermia bacterium 64_32]|nr:MAG: Uncharacterized protein XD60_0540 [Acetothermia bacterium 64_32]HAF71167.1 hypothetical protein [Candidatus Acetothermia bacterium]